MKLEDTINTCAKRGETLAYLFEGKAHYPVPALREPNMDGVLGDWWYYRGYAKFLDWSRGMLEVY